MKPTRWRTQTRHETLLVALTGDAGPTLVGDKRDEGDIAPGPAARRRGRWHGAERFSGVQRCPPGPRSSSEEYTMFRTKTVVRTLTLAAVAVVATLGLT